MQTNILNADLNLNGGQIDTSQPLEASDLQQLTITAEEFE